VYVFLGSNVLHTVRYPGSGNEYSYVGECYVHGLMDGEVMDWIEDSTIKVERFILV
jgi:hypothetical protein